MIEWIWLFAQVATGLFYLHIPFEMAYWGRRIPHKGLWYVLGLFMAFIIACGLHHLNMAVDFLHHGKIRYLVTDVPMAVVSGICSAALVHLRGDIVTVLKRGLTNEDTTASS